MPEDVAIADRTSETMRKVANARAPSPSVDVMKKSAKFSPLLGRASQQAALKIIGRNRQPEQPSKLRL